MPSMESYRHEFMCRIQSESQFLNESAAFSALGWTRGGDSQALVVGFGPDPTGQGGDGFLMVMLATK